VIPRGLTGRIVAAFALLALLILIAVWATVFVNLRDLERRATETRLADTADLLLAQIRDNIVDTPQRAEVVEFANRLGAEGINVYVATADGRLRTLSGQAVGVTPVDVGAARGDTRRGETTIGDDQYLYASMVLRPRAVGPLGQSVVFATIDRSGADAIADLGRSVPLAALIVVIVGAPLAWLLGRSVAAPLRRLSAAAGRLVVGRPDPLPVEGPTEVRSVTTRFNALADEIERARRHELDLLANLRHDLRTPLTVIGGFAGALSDGTATGEEAERAARVIGEEAERLSRLVAELGSIERLRSGADGLRPEQLDANGLLSETVERFATRAAGLGVELNVASPSQPATDDGQDVSFAADRGAVERILANLVDNALYAAPSPGGHVWLTAAPVSAENGVGPGVALTVSDDGPGFPPGTADRVFERFYRADPARSGAGSGLGLAIVEELAKAHGGTAHAENVAPRGARVSVILPKVPSTRPPA
jgi:signal transduction histidine kinase